MERMSRQFVFFIGRERNTVSIENFSKSPTTPKCLYHEWDDWGNCDGGSCDGGGAAGFTHTRTREVSDPKEG